MVAKSNEDGEEAFMCVKVQRPRPSGKCSTNGSTTNDWPIYSAAMPKAMKGRPSFWVGRLNGQGVKVLRDTGCTEMIVDRALFTDTMVIPGISGSLQMVDSD